MLYYHAVRLECSMKVHACPLCDEGVSKACHTPSHWLILHRLHLMYTAVPSTRPDRLWWFLAIRGWWRTILVWPPTPPKFWMQGSSSSSVVRASTAKGRRSWVRFPVATQAFFFSVCLYHQLFYQQLLYQQLFYQQLLYQQFLPPVISIVTKEKNAQFYPVSLKLYSRLPS